MDEPSMCPHILIFPLPAQGHVRPMLKLAELLCLGGLQVSFLNSTYIHHRLLSHSGASLARFTRYSGFRFETISDGLPMEHPRIADRIDEFFDALRTKTKPLFREKMISWCGHGESCETRSPVTCVLLDGVLGFSIDVTEEFGVPVIHFRCSSACSLWTYFSLNQLTEAGDFPFKDDDLDRLVTSLPEMEGFLRRRDLPSFFRTSDADDPFLQFCMKGIRRTTRTHGLTLNTFEDLEGPVLSQFRNHCPKIYAVGPLHQHLKSRLPSETSTTSQSSSSLWEEDKSCIAWLDRQPSRHVVYVSFGSIAAVKKEEFMEFWYGLVNSGCQFLWVVRPDCSLPGEDGGAQAPVELLEGTEKRGLLVRWAPQQEVLAHPAVGCFLTHSGWNSTLEGLAAGVPMICWPHFSDQQINSRFASHVWKLGLDMKDTCDRITIEKMIRTVMEEKRAEFMKSADSMAELAKRSVSEGGSSYYNLISLIQDIKLLSLS